MNTTALRAPAPAPAHDATALLSAITVTDVHKAFGATQAVDGITLDIPAGQIVALLGQNGAGKTTLIDVILGLQAPDSGTTRLYGLSPKGAIRRSLVGVVHQTGALLPEYTVEQTVRVFGGAHARPLPIDQVLAEADLTHLAKRRVGKLSGGEQQRVRLALALVPDPLLLILDEPTAGMDALARRSFWELMRTQADAGRTIVFATHYLTEAQDFAERTIIVKSGRVITDAYTAEVRRMDRTRTLRMTIGEGDAPALEVALCKASGFAGWTVTWGTDEVLIRGADLDDAARILLAHPTATDLEITPSTLEDVFTELTS